MNLHDPRMRVTTEPDMPEGGLIAVLAVAALLVAIIAVGAYQIFYLLSVLAAR